MDDLSLTYNGDRLIKATNEAAASNTYNSMHFLDASDETSEYSYDANGNLTKDSNKNILSIQYNSLNLPQKITLPYGAFEEMTYSIDGDKLRVRKKNVQHGTHPGTGGVVQGYMLNNSSASTPNSNLANTTLQSSLAVSQAVISLYPTTDYCGSVIYKDGSLLRIMIDGGYVTLKQDGTPSYHFF